ncbi:MAG TPA: tetratricopeptide repeat protein [Candidatus Methanoperedens sp.]|nr:tetratricopeptide repeat protein [Candidatus Methanoperedens sp.]
MAGRGRLLALLLIAALSAAPYLARGGLRTFTQLDDSAYVPDNGIVLRGLGVEGVRWAFTTFHMGNWHPLTWLSHLFAATLFGADAWWHHQWNVLFHALNAALLFVALGRLTGSPWRSALVAALFGVHPLHVESVAWVAEHKDVLSGFFFMLVLLAYERHARRPGARRLAVVTLLLAAGLMAKPMLVTVPFVLLLLDFWPLGRLRGSGGVGGIALRSALLEKLPLFALALGSSVVTYLAQQAGGAVVSAGKLPVPYRAANAVVSYGEYLRTALWPWPLAVFYPYPGAQPWWRVAAAAAVLVAASAGVAALRRRGYLAAGWFWFVGMLVPVIGLVQVGNQARADRYMYLPLAGLLVAGVWGGADLAWRRRGAAAGAAAALVVALAALCAVQADFWRDSETLFRHTLAVSGESGIIRNNLGTALFRAGRKEEAVEHFREAVHGNPGSLLFRTNLVTTLAEVGRREEALAHYREGLRLNPGAVAARESFAIALLEAGRPEEAIGELRALLETAPSAPAYTNLGSALALAGRAGESEEAFRAALSLDPAYVGAHLGAAVACAGRGDFPGAFRHLLQAAALAPGDGRLPGAFAEILARPGAREAFEKARAADPALGELAARLRARMAQRSSGS